MSRNTDNFDRIETYLFGQMNANDASAFEQETKNDKELAAELEQHRLEHRAMELLLQQELRANLNDWKSEKESLQQSGSTTTKVVSMGSARKWFQLAAAASVALLLGFFVRSLFFADGSDFNQLAMEQFGSNVPSVRGETMPLSAIYDLMAQKQYRQALEMISSGTIVADAPILADLRGECQFLLKDYTAAAMTYTQLLSTPALASDLRENAEWRLALSYLAQENKQEDARSQLEKIIAADGTYAKRAKDIKGKMK
jgi:tetratricopeptide (TPR) repeat protein